MKKLLFGAAALLLMASCSGNGTTEKANYDSTRIADSVAQVDTAKAKAEVEKVSQDSIKQESITKEEKAEKNKKSISQYGDLLNKYSTAVNAFEKEAKRSYGSEKTGKLKKKCEKIESEIKKIKSNLSKEQLSKFNVAKKKYNEGVSYWAP